MPLGHKHPRNIQETSKNVTDNVGENVGVNVGVKTNLDQKNIDEIRLNGRTTAEEMSLKFGVTKRTIERHLAELKKHNRIKRNDSDKGGYWEVVD